MKGRELGEVSFINGCDNCLVYDSLSNAFISGDSRLIRGGLVTLRDCVTRNKLFAISANETTRCLGGRCNSELGVGTPLVYLGKAVVFSARGGGVVCGERVGGKSLASVGSCFRGLSKTCVRARVDPCATFSSVPRTRGVRGVIFMDGSTRSYFGLERHLRGHCNSIYSFGQD